MTVVIGKPSTSPTRKAVFVVDDLSSDVNQRARIPLTPAMRPWAAIMIKAASPMSAPPKKELRGENSVIILQGSLVVSLVQQLLQ